MRHQDWPTRFEAFCAARRGMPFAWGANDCATFAADCVQAITGQDPAPEGLRKHRTARQAARALRRHGGLVGIASAALGAPVSALQAGVGDVVLITAGNHTQLAICNGQTALAPGAQGLLALGMGNAVHCWRVG